MDISRLITLKKIVAEAIALSGSPKSRFYLMFQTLINGVTDLNLFSGSAVKRELLDMDANYVIDIPGDCLSIISIGIPINGKNWLFSEDSELLAISSDDGDWTDAVDEFSTSGYGVRGNKNTDYFKIDWENNRVVFNSPEKRSNVIFTFISSGVDLTAETEVPLTSKAVLVSWILWKEALYNSKTYYNRTEILRVDYERELNKFRELRMPSIEEIQNTIRKSYRQGPKR